MFGMILTVTAATFVHKINRMGFLIQKKCVFCPVSTKLFIVIRLTLAATLQNAIFMLRFLAVAATRWQHKATYTYFAERCRLGDVFCSHLRIAFELLQCCLPSVAPENLNLKLNLFIFYISKTG